MSKIDEYVRICEVLPYRKILVAIDNTFRSAKALCRAIMIAKKFNSKLIIIHVIPKKLPYAQSKKIEPPKEIYEHLFNEGKEILDHAKKIAMDAGIDAEIVLLEGDIAEEILNFVNKEGDIDLIVIGRKDKEITKYLGSVSEKIAKESKIPVLIEF
ncbi:MAG: universal stress protein [Candidatus Methanomethylicia archaeon]|nr:universal stress protein [Candidatus Methanomethylicia archaeon]